MVIGMVKMIAKEFYHLQVNVELKDTIEEEGSDLPYHYKLSIEMDEGRRNDRTLRRMCVRERCEGVKGRGVKG